LSLKSSWQAPALHPIHGMLLLPVLAGVAAAAVLHASKERVTERARTRAHLAAVQRWGETVWQAWAPHHAEVRRWTAALLDAPTREPASQVAASVGALSLPDARH
jgi:hypothetical protein